MPTFAIRCEPYADNDRLFYVYTIKSDGCRHEFAHGSQLLMLCLQRDLSKLTPSTIAILVADSAAEYGEAA